MMEIYSETPQVSDAMVGVAKPDIEVLEDQDTFGQFSVEPMERGLGMTIGNSVRRVLLSSIESAAITWLKIDGIQHEYSTIDHVTEDVTEFLLNVKAIRLKSNSDQPGRLVLDVRGEGQVCAGDISPSSEYEVANPELHLATLDSEEARLSVEFNVERGRGYLPAGNTNGLPIGALPVDAVFTPIRKINFDVETIRIGPYIGKEKLVLDVWTDGTMRPVEALREAGEALVGYFYLFANAGKVLYQGAEKRPLNIPPEHYNMSLENLGLTARTLNCLKRDNLTKVGEVLEKGKEGLLSIRNFGEKSLVELYEAFEAKGIEAVFPEDEESEEETPSDETEDLSEESPAEEETEPDPEKEEAI